MTNTTAGPPYAVTHNDITCIGCGSKALKDLAEIVCRRHEGDPSKPGFRLSPEYIVAEVALRALEGQQIVEEPRFFRYFDAVNKIGVCVDCDKRDPVLTEQLRRAGKAQMELVK